MKWDALIESYLNVLPRLSPDAYEAVLAEIARLKQLQKTAKT